MWNAKSERINDEITRTLLSDDAGALSSQAVIGLWHERADFRAYFSQLLGASMFAAFFWETPSITRQTWHRPFEFVLVHALSAVRDPGITV
jgi:hypothetical protein